MKNRRRTQKHRENLARKVAKDRDDRASCDLEIVCGERRFPVHRTVVCLYSPVIRAACLGPWKEAALGVFEIKETSHVLVRRMLDYIYTGDYDRFDASTLAQKDRFSPQEVAKFDTADHITLHSKMMELGDMYMIEGLGQLTSDKFAEYLEHWTTRDILVTIIPKLYALELEFDSFHKIREIVTDCVRRKLAQVPWGDDIKELLRDTIIHLPQFICGLFISMIEALVLRHFGIHR
ncbi:hypothetical protein E4U32_002924 [Claviceps aff. humidiphila group G2b]|nr:hypothetical protein E4U32_002924 [Claviceps aff. humidiphila group G2b]